MLKFLPSFFLFRFNMPFNVCHSFSKCLFNVILVYSVVGRRMLPRDVHPWACCLNVIVSLMLSLAILFKGNYLICQVVLAHLVCFIFLPSVFYFYLCVLLFPVAYSCFIYSLSLSFRR